MVRGAATFSVMLASMAVCAGCPSSRTAPATTAPVSTAPTQPPRRPAPPRPSHLALGATHSCVLDVAGSPWCWGDNERGQLGRAGRGGPTPMRVAGVGTLRLLAAGDDRTCGVDAKGSVLCWGGGAPSPRRVEGVANPTALAISAARGCAATQDGVACWSWSRFAALAVSDAPRTRSVATDRRWSCAVGPKRKLHCWTAHRSPKTVAGISDATRVAVVRGRACVIRGSGSVACVVLATGARSEIAGTTDAVAIAGGHRHLCTVGKDGRVGCWGDNRSRQLGVDTKAAATSAPGPAVSGIGQVVEAAAGGSHTCAITRSAKLWCWGANAIGQLARPPASRRGETESLPGLSGVRALVSRGGRTCALPADGRLRCWGTGVIEFGDTDADAPHPTPATRIPRLHHLSLGYAHGCGIDPSRHVVCWGANSHGQGGGAASATDSHAVIGIDHARAVSVGFRHSCAIDATSQVRCWGDNAQGQLARSGGASRSPVDIPGTNGTVAIASDDNTTCAVDDSGAIRCWGWMPGAGRTPTPTVVSGVPPARAVALARSHACALTGTGEVWCWGRNNYGQLGDGTRALQSTAVKASGLGDAVAIAVTLNRTCAVHRGGGVSCWGVTWRSGHPRCRGGSGAPARPCNASPTPVPAVTDVVSLTMGAGHTCALRRDGTVRCWGPDLPALGWGADADLGQPKPVVLPK